MKHTYEQLKNKIRKIWAIGLYFLFQHRRIVTKLSLYGLSNIKPYQIRRWFRVIRGKVLMRLYYVACFNGEPCFIKLAKSGSDTIKNEIIINEYLTRCDIEFVPKLLASKDNFYKNNSILVTEFVSDMRPFKLSADKSAFESICEQFEQIYNQFLDFGIIHGDITDANLLLTHNNRILLIDFGLGKIPGLDDSQLRSSLQYGMFCQLKEGVRIYDDAYSFLKMLDNCGISESFKQMDCYKRIERMVGTHTHSITEQTGRNRI